MTRRPVSISDRLLWMNLTVSGTALVLAIIAFFLYDVVSFRENLIRSLETSAQIVGTNSVAAIVFNDPESAMTTLDALRSSPDVNEAVLITSDGVRFATYTRFPGAPQFLATLPPVSGDADEHWLRGGGVILAHPVVFEGKLTGIVYIAAKLTETSPHARQYLGIAALILLLCMLAALLVSRNAGRTMARPLIALSETARQVSREKNYSVRARRPAENDEISELVQAFNEMLAQIQERDTALNLARATLERRVEERTAALRAANSELEAFSYAVAHDLRGPLDAVQGMVYLLQTGDGEAGAERTEILGQLRESTRSMAALIDDLLNLSQAGTAALKCEAIDLGAMARHIADRLQRSDPERQVEFRIKQPALANADAGLMRIALDNLLRNAWKYSSHHQLALVEFGVEQVDGETVYYVRDNGAGFDPALKNQLFQPFHRLHSREEFAGTGIGLATVQRILERHGGRIWAEGEVEKGATFYFTVACDARIAA